MNKDIAEMLRKDRMYKEMAQRHLEKEKEFYDSMPVTANPGYDEPYPTGRTRVTEDAVIHVGNKKDKVLQKKKERIPPAPRKKEEKPILNLVMEKPEVIEAINKKNKEFLESICTIPKPKKPKKVLTKKQKEEQKRKAHQRKKEKAQEYYPKMRAVMERRNNKPITTRELHDQLKGDKGMSTLNAFCNALVELEIMEKKKNGNIIYWRMYDTSPFEIGKPTANYEAQTYRALKINWIKIRDALLRRGDHSKSIKDLTPHVKFSEPHLRKLLNMAVKKGFVVEKKVNVRRWQVTEKGRNWVPDLDEVDEPVLSVDMNILEYLSEREEQLNKELKYRRSVEEQARLEQVKIDGQLYELDLIKRMVKGE